MSRTAVITETHPSGVNGGSTTGGVWTPRNLNNLSIDAGATWCTLNATTGQFTLTSGKYLISASAVGVGVGSHQLRIKNATNNLYYYGLSSLSYNLLPSNSGLAQISTYIDITASKTFALEHFFEKSISNFGKGFAVGASGNTEVYANLSILKF